MSRPVFAGVLGGIVQDLGWADQANCRNMDINLFFPDVGVNIDPFVKEVCAMCDVQTQCLWYANETKSDHGIFAGMSPNQRKEWRQRNKVVLGMSYDAWRAKQQEGRLYTNPEDWRDDEQAV